MTPNELRMPRSTRGRAVGGLGVMVALAAVVAFVVGVRESDDLPADAALSYEGTVVTEAELDRHAEVLGALYGIQEPEEADKRDAFQRDIAKAVAVSMILENAAEEQDIVISDKAARDTLASMVEGQLGSDPRAFTDLLTRFGVTEHEILVEVKRQQAIARLFQDRTVDAVEDVTPEEVRAYFAEDPARFATPERRALRNIVVKTRREAAALVARLRRGDDFVALARATSLDDATRARGGAMGLVRADELEATYADAAFAAAPGRVFGPVRTQFGWNVGQVVRVLPGEDVRFEDVETEVTDHVRSERALAAWRDWLRDRIRAADVEYAAAYRPEDPDEPPALATDLP